MKQWYQELFENYASSYDREPFTKGTAAEADFIEQELDSDKSKSILDIGCSPGEFNRETTLTTDHFEMLVIAEK